MAPSITIARAIKAFSGNGNGGVPKDRFVVYTLDPKDEQNDSIYIYPSSLLTYVADHLEDENSRVPLLGIRDDFNAAGIDFATPVAATESVKHGEFDNDGHEIETIFTRLAQAEF
jgi:hypothetical protein